MHEHHNCRCALIAMAALVEETPSYKWGAGDMRLKHDAPRLPKISDPSLRVSDCDMALAVLRNEAKRLKGKDPIHVHAIGRLMDEWLDKRVELEQSERLDAQMAQTEEIAPVVEGAV